MAIETSSAKRLTQFLFEAGELKRVKRSGWWNALVKEPESVAEHSYRTAVIAYALAEMETPTPKARGENTKIRLDSSKLAVAALFHDFHEARLLDLHKLSAKYLGKAAKESAAKKITADQQSGLPFKIDFALSKQEQDILSDADQLEMALQAREYFDAGHKVAWKWIESARKRLRTINAKLIMKELENQESTSWWQELKQN